MTNKPYDIIIIGSGMSGLYSAYNIKKTCPNCSFLILEKYKKQWIGGRTSNANFYGTQIVTGAGIGRKDTNPLLIKLMKQLKVPFTEYNSVMNYSRTFKPVDIVKIINILKSKYKSNPELHEKSFKEYFISLLGEDCYKNFVISAGYSDYENADILETLYNYGMDDNKGGWTGLHIPWKELVNKLYHEIGEKHFKFSCNVSSIKKINENPCLFEIKTEKNSIFYSNKVILATTITSIQKLIPDALEKNSIYQQIHGQPFLGMYAKFNKKSAEIISKYVTNYTIVPGPLQKIIPINSNKGVYMISYSDNKNALILKKHLENTSENRKLYCLLLEKSLGIPNGSLEILALKDFYWPIGTHYYEPLPKVFNSRDDFLNKVQHPEKGLLIVGEAVSRYQGWTEGALESVITVLDKKWIQNEC